MRKLLIVVCLCLTMGISLQVQAQCNAPIINSFSPNTGFIGSTVTITGANFDPIPANNQVFFGATQATVLTASFGVLTVQVPVGASTAPIAVKNGCNLIAYSSVSFNGIFCPTPIDATTYNNVAFNLAGVVGAYNMLAQDLDMDGKPEVVSAYGGLTVARNNSTPGNLNFTAYNFPVAWSYNSHISTADFDGDGKRDLFGTHNIYRNTSTGPGNINFTVYPLYNVTNTYTSGYQSNVGDFNNDGKMDLVVDNASGTMYFYRNTSTGPGNISFAFAGSYYVQFRSTGVQCVDADGDGKTDVLATQGDGNRLIALRNMTAAGANYFAFAGLQSFGTGGLYPYRCQIADFDKDGRIDLATVNYNSPANTVNTAVLRNISTVGNINFALANTYPGPNSNYRIGVGDVNGDGYPDIVTKSLAVQAFAVYPNTSTGSGNISFSPRFDYPSAATAEVSGIVIGDLDGDFVPDIATSGTSSNTIRFHRNTSAQVDNTPPTAKCKNITVGLSPTGTAVVTAQMIDNGSGDACGVGSLQINDAASVTFTCANIGANSVTLKVTDKAGNVSTCTATVTVAPAAIIVSGQTTVCQGQTVLLNANLGDSYQWQKDGVDIPGATSQTYTATSSGDYTVTVTNAGGCSGTSAATSVTVNNNPTVAITPAGAASLCPPNGTLTISATLSSIYQWKKDGNNIPSATQQSITVNTAGSYSVQVVDLFGCSATSDPVVVSATDNIPPVAKCKNVTVALNSNGSAGVTVADINDGSYDNCTVANIAIRGLTSYDCSNVGQPIPVTLTVTDAAGNTSSCTANVTVTAGLDTDGDGVGDICDQDDDNDGITDVAECNNSNFFWSNPPATSGNTATGVINGVNYTYTSSQTVLTTPSVFAHNVFPAQYNIPNIKCIQNIYASSNTLTFSSPISNPVLVFASIGQSGIAVPIQFSSPIEVLWSTAVVQNSDTRITGNEGYAIVRLNGTFSSISFDYLADENWVNFLFGADFQNCIDTDGDGTLDYLDTDSDNDGCPDAIEGSQNPSLSQTSNGRLTGGVDAMGIPLVVNGGQGIGTSKNANANCFCQPGIDKTAPEITCPASVSVNATSTAGAAVNYAEPTVNDDCQYTLVRTSGPASGSTFPIGTTTVTYKATNLAGLTAECSFDVSVIAVAPSIVCPSNITVNNDAGQCGANVTFAATETTGIPASTISYSHQPGSHFPVGTTTVTATATNVAGSSSCTFTVTVNDTENPVPSQPSLPVITAECGATAPVPTATDNCGGLINGVPSGPVSFTTQGTHTITWTYTDAAGNSTSQQQTVVIDDNTPPVIACPFNISVNADPGVCGAVVNYNQPSATDNCGSGNLPTSIAGYTYKGMFDGHTYFVSNSPATPEAAHAAAIALGGHLATISSAAENSFIAAMRPDRMWIGFTDRDVEGTYRWVTNEPILYTNWSGGEPNNAGGNEDWAVINWSGTTWNDWFYTQPAYYVVEFEGGIIPTTLVSGLPSGSVFPIGVNTVTYRATDAGGNTVTCSFTVTVTDNQAPQIVCPSNITVNSEPGICAAKVTVPAMNISDNCDVIRYTETFDSYPGGPAINRSGLLRPWTGATAGVVVNNPSSSPSNSLRISNFQDQLFLLGDRTSGKWDVRFRMFVPAGSAGYYNIQHFEAEGTEWAQEVQFSSNGTGRLRVSNQLTPFNYPQGQWFDVQQNFDLDADQTTLTINGVVVKSWQFSMLANTGMGTKQLGGFDFFGVTANMGNTEPNPGAPAVFFIDNISVAGSKAPMSGYVPRAYSISYPVGTTPVTVRIQDGSGNNASCSFNVTVVDNQPPVINGTPADIVQSNDPGACGAVVSWVAPVATDNCSGVTITQTAGPASGTSFPVGTTTVTYTATDGAGNAVSSSFTVTVNDTEAPVLNGVPADATVSCTAVPAAANVTAADNCPGVATVVYNEVKTDGSCAGNYTLTRTWSVTDAHNNSNTATQVITVQDTEAPVISCPASVTVNCQDNTSTSALGSATATDDCSGVTITSSDVSTQDADINSSGHYNYTISRTWTATDGCGNASTCVQTITVHDITAPTPVCRNVEVTLVNGAASITPAMIDGGSSDNCSPLSLSASRLNFSCADIGSHTVTLTVTDVSGNSSSCNATVTVKGEIPTCRITSVPANNVYTGGVSTNLYLGYGAQQTTLQLDVPASGAPYTFQWSGNGVANLSSTTAQSPVFAPVAAGSYTFTVFITNRYGCTTTCTISICVTDIRVPGRNGTWDGKKVYVCHVPPGNPGNTQTLQISVNAVPAHIGPSGHATDRLGRCDQTPCGGVIGKPPVATPVKTTASELVVKLSPNPTSSQFALQVMSADQRTPVVVRVMNALGKLVDVQQTTIGDILRFGSNYVSGTYFIEVVQGDQKKVVQGVKAN